MLAGCGKADPDCWPVRFSTGYLLTIKPCSRGLQRRLMESLTERSGAMKSPTERIMGYAEAKPEATPIQAKDTVRSVYLTSGPDRILHFEAHRVELLHAPSWQLAAPNRNAGAVIRAVAWLSPNEI